MASYLDQYSMPALCQALCVGRSGFYAWRKREHGAKAIDVAVSNVYIAQRCKVGAPSVAAGVAANGFKVSESTVGRSMKRQGLRARMSRKFRHTTDSKHSYKVSPNLLDRQFKVAMPNQVWVGDITYLRVREGWLYLAVMIDLFSRQVVGWQMSDRINQELVNDALDAALTTRGKPNGVMIHSDQGVQYCAKSFRKIIADNHLTQSMSRKANCWDNAVAESFFASLKKQSVYGYSLKTRDAIRSHIFEYIEIYYNRVRRHSTNGWLSPVDFERLHHKTIEEQAVHLND